MFVTFRRSICVTFTRKERLITKKPRYQPDVIRCYQKADFLLDAKKVEELLFDKFLEL